MSATGEPTNLDLLLTLTRIEVKIETLGNASQDHELRIRTLEKARWPLPTLGVLTGVGGLAFTLFTRFS